MDVKNAAICVHDAVAFVTRHCTGVEGRENDTENSIPERTDGIMLGPLRKVILLQADCGGFVVVTHQDNAEKMSAFASAE